jgi:hypothetical protein
VGEADLIDRMTFARDRNRDQVGLARRRLVNSLGQKRPQVT